MWKTIFLNAVKMLFLLLAVSFITFMLVEFSPIDAVSAYIGENSATDAQREQIAEYWGLNQPPLTRYLKWISNLLHGDMGTSMIYRQPVIKVISEHFKLSFWLMLFSWILSGILGLLLGVTASVYRESVIDKIIKIYCLASGIFSGVLDWNDSAVDFLCQIADFSHGAGFSGWNSRGRCYTRRKNSAHDSACYCIKPDRNF